MSQVVQPRTLAVELTDGEAALLEFLRRELNDDWTIYVQPFLNGDEPDLVALNPHAGIMPLRWGQPLTWDVKGVT